jgi:hypothetical protein
VFQYVELLQSGDKGDKLFFGLTLFDYKWPRKRPKMASFWRKTERMTIH